MKYNMLLILISIVAFTITMGAQLFIKLRYSIYKNKKNIKGITGHDAARIMLDKNGLSHVKLQQISGELTDHYDPTAKIIRLSSKIYSGSSIASVAVACHECGHAIQDKDDYGPLRLRHNLVPLVNISSSAGYFAIAIGLALSMIGLVWLGIILESVILVFQLVTLPVEFDASARALHQIKELKLLDEKEHKGAKKVLIAAALTYVASVASTLLQLFRLILIYGRRKKDD